MINSVTNMKVQLQQFFESKQSLRKLNVQLQNALTNSLDVLTALDPSTSYTGNPYKTYNSKVQALSDMFEGKADWGNQILQSVINVRTAFTLGSGLRFIPEEGVDQRQVDFLNDFITMNGLDQDTPSRFAKEAEVEGKFLCQLVPDKNWKRPGGESGMVKVIYMPWTELDYTIYPDGADYTAYKKAMWTNPPELNSVTKLKPGEVALSQDQFVYGVFGGRLFIINEPTPVLSGSLPQIENLDKALTDLRQINHLFASPTPFIECEDGKTAKDVDTKLRGEELNWKIGKLLILAKSKFSMVGVDATGVKNLIEEIVSLIKVISGNTGVPVHFLGFTDLMSNRATAENLLESINAATEGSRYTWIKIYTDMFNKVLMMSADKLQTGFNQLIKFDIEFPLVSAQKMQELVETWLPLYVSGVIDLETMLSKVPDIDADAVLKAKEAEKAEELARTEFPVPGEEEENE